MNADTRPWYGRIVVLSASSVVTLVLDLIIVPHIAFPALFVLPIALVAWWHTLRAAIVLALVLVAARTVNVIFRSTTHSHPLPYELTNSVIYLGILIALIYLIARLAEQRRQLRKGKTLPALLPICSYCHRIRRDDGEWEQIESFITKRTGTLFSHGFCPECMEAQWAEYQSRPSQS